LGSFGMMPVIVHVEPAGPEGAGTPDVPEVTGPTPEDVPSSEA
jgi:hypothetical protein